MLAAASDKVAALETVDTGRGVKSALARSPAAGFNGMVGARRARPRNPRGQFGLLAEEGRTAVSVLRVGESVSVVSRRNRAKMTSWLWFAGILNNTWDA